MFDLESLKTTSCTQSYVSHNSVQFLAHTIGYVGILFIVRLLKDLGPTLLVFDRVISTFCVLIIPHSCPLSYNIAIIPHGHSVGYFQYPFVLLNVPCTTVTDCMSENGGKLRY